MVKFMTKVQIAYIHTENVSHSFHHSMMKLSARSSEVLLPYTASAFASTLGLIEARSALMEYFLDDTDATHIWWIDTDMGFAPNTVEVLLESQKDVIGGVCYGMAKPQPDEFGGYHTKPFLVAFDLVQPTEEEPIYYSLSQDLDLDTQDPIQVAATGTGCLLVSRHAATLVRETYGDVWFEQVTYTKDGKKRHKVSEDLSFCYRLATLGIPVYIHPRVRTNHAKTVWLQGEEK